MAKPFEHILVPLDFTDKNASALNIALEMAGQNQARVTLLHVIETIEQLRDDEIDQFYAKLEANAEGRLADAAEPFVQVGITPGQEIVYGRRGPEILRYSMEQEVDLVVLSSHKIDLKQPTQGWGTLSYQVSTFCQCPVLLVK